jgi:hypothetical protein
MDERDAGIHSTGPEVRQSTAEARAARKRMATALPVLFGSVFVAFVVVAAVVLGARYLF